ncbi:Nitrogen assimilation transcription factor nirA [Fusarium oxysporum f. sp. conglutinans]|nr:Nitrogen assimilation transcription factor nirA [Fusarium oxysporum f. sp. conglutinans]
MLIEGHPRRESLEHPRDVELVKCDSQRPKCGACQAKNIRCEYPQDARRTTVRTRKEDVAALQKQVDDLKEQMLTQSQHPPLGTTYSALGSFQAETRPTYPGLIDQSLQQAITPSSSFPVISSASPASRDTPLSSRQDNQWSNAVTQPANDDPLLMGPGAGIPRDGTKTPEVDSDEDSPQVYGATSLLHDKSSTIEPTPRRNQPSRDSWVIEAARDKLIAYAAIHRQEEIALHSSPNLGANIDFDGVPLETAMHLLDLHWNRQHLSYLLTYRPAIMDSLINNGPNVNKLLLNAIYLQSSLYSDRIDLRHDLQNPSTVGIAFYERFKSLLVDYIDKPTLPTIVALLTCGACLVPRGKQSAGWVYCGMAYRMMTDLGYNLDLKVTLETGVGPRLSVIEIEMRRRVYWAAYVNDKFQSLFLGRPPAISGPAGHVSQEYLDCYEEKELWRPYVDPLGGLTANSPSDTQNIAYPGRPTYVLSTFHCLLQLCRIAAHIIESFYSAQSPELLEASLLQTRDEIRVQLSVWRDSIPSWLQFNPDVDSVPPPHQITPHTTYWSLVILTEQVFLSRGRFSFTLDPIAQEEGRQRCVEAALQIWKLVEAYKKTFSLRRAQYGISYATYCAVLVLLQHTSQDSDTYVECIQFFWLALLEYQKGCNYGLKRPLRLLKSLMQRLEKVNQNVDTEMRATAAPDISSEMNSILGHNAMCLQGFDQWNGTWLGNIGQDDTIFGIADDSILGVYM